MIDKLKTYFVEVVIKNVGPKVSASVISAGLAFLAAHQEYMEQMGITYYPNFNGIWSGIAPTGRLLVIEIDTLQVWGGLALVAAAVALWTIIQHHTVATVTGAPHSGDLRINPPASVEGGQRASDPPPAA